MGYGAKQLIILSVSITRSNSGIATVVVKIRQLEKNYCNEKF
jgi:hypothetical protein